MGTAVGRLLVVGDVVALDGELGTGKTRVAEGIARGLGFTGEVTSPTFTLAHEYGADIPIAHVDAYRMADADEFLSLGVSELWEDGVVVVEWASRVSDALPSDRATITGQVLGESERQWVVHWSGAGRLKAALEEEGFDVT